MNKIVGLCVVLLFVFWITLSGNPAAAQSNKEEELTTREIAEAARPAVYLTLMPEKQGTGFLISKDPPLVVTAAHDVANYLGPREVWMRQNETGNESQVKAVYIHPDYKPVTSEGYSPDVALLELELYEHDLGTPLRLKKPQECEDLREQEIVVIGFPFYASATKEERQNAEVVVRDGLVSRLCDYDFGSTRLPIRERPMMELSLRTFAGDSGNPVIDRSGAVVGVVHGQRTLTYKESNQIVERQHIPIAIHVREVWKLLELKYPEVAKKLKE